MPRPHPMSDSALAPPFARSLAVVVGIDAYSHGVPPLRTAVNDARRLGGILAAQHGYDVITLLDAEATGTRLASLLRHDLPARMGPDDRLVFYFAGHGVALDGQDGPNGYLLPVDASRADASTFLSMPLVSDAISALPCRHVLVILDSCFSGAFRWSSTRAAAALPEVIHQERYARFVRDPAWQVITSASQDQEALDRLASGTLGSRTERGEHSPFALALFEALEGRGDLVPREGGDGLMTATELYLYIEDRLQTAALQAGTRQTPRLWPMPRHDKGEFVFTVPGRELSLPPAPPLDLTANPWRGLAAYDRADAPLFFGRETATRALQEAIERSAFVVVLGASGTGKSSLVKAGVLPRLESDSRWQVLPVVRPGAAPLDALARTLSAVAPGGAAVAPDRLDDAVGTWCRQHAGRRLLLVVDQCEELVTMTRTASDRDAALTLLARLIEAYPLQVAVVLTLRTDFEPQFDRSPLGAGWQDARFVVPPMSRADLKAVIEQPASARVLYFEPASLVDTLLDDVVNTPGGLPLLSFALSEMYVRYVGRPSSDRALTKADYEAIGGVVGALRSRADHEYESLDEAHRASMRHLMLRMVAGGTASLARRRVSDRELEFADPAENARVREVLHRLTEARLVVEDRDVDGDGYAEPAHDALVRAWGRLIGWIHEAGADPLPLAMRQKLSAAALDWARTTDRAAQRGLLWSDSARSALLAPLLRTDAAWLNTRERLFVERSVRGRRRARRAAVATTVGMAALAVASLVFGLQARQRAAEARVQQQAATTAAARAREEEARASAAAARAQLEKERAVRSLFSSLQLYLSRGNAGSVCTYPGCLVAPPGDGDDEAWFSIGRLPDEVPNLWAPTGEESREFIVARDYGSGHVLVYAHDGLTRDDEARGEGADNLTFAENALRWLGRSATPAGCGDVTTIVFWEGTFLRVGQITAMTRFIDRRGWRFVVTSPASLESDLRCASVLWYASDWDPPPDFATRHVPAIERFVRDGGGLLVGGLGWSYAQQGPDAPYAANELGRPFGFAFSLNAFEANPRQPIRLLMR